MARLLKAAVLLIAIASPALADEGASGLYVPGNFGFGAGVTPDAGFYLSTGLAHYDGDIKIFIDGGKIVLNAEKRPYCDRLRDAVGSRDESPRRQSWAVARHRQTSSRGPMAR